MVIRLHLGVVLCGLLGAPAHAGELPPTRDLDGLYLTVGPAVAATAIENEWVTGAGGELSLVYLRENCLPALVGLSAGGLGYGDRDGGRLWLEIEAGLQAPLPVGIGIGAGVTAEVDPVRPPRYGVQGTLWIFAGVIPYLRAGTLEEAGRFAEIGLLVKLPVPRLLGR